MNKIDLTTEELDELFRESHAMDLSRQGVTELERIALAKHFEGNLFRGYHIGYDITTPDKLYAVRKVTTGVFQVRVYNNKDTSQPLSEYYLTEDSI